MVMVAVLDGETGLGGRRLQPPDEHDVHAPAQHLRPHAGHARLSRGRAAARANERRSQLYAIAYRHQLARGTENAGTVRAISAETGATVWLHEQRAATSVARRDRRRHRLRRRRQRAVPGVRPGDGRGAAEINLGSAVTGFPITYAVDGQQFVAVSTGSGGMSSHFTGLTPELRTSAGNSLFVFAVP